MGVMPYLLESMVPCFFLIINNNNRIIDIDENYTTFM